MGHVPGRRELETWMRNRSIDREVIDLHLYLYLSNLYICISIYSYVSQTSLINGMLLFSFHLFVIYVNRLYSPSPQEPN